MAGLDLVKSPPFCIALSISCDHVIASVGANERARSRMHFFKNLLLLCSSLVFTVIDG